METEPTNKEEASFEADLFDEKDAKRSQAAEEIFNLEGMHRANLGLVKDIEQQAEIRNLIAEYSSAKSFSQKEKITEKISGIINMAWDEAHPDPEK